MASDVFTLADHSRCCNPRIAKNIFNIKSLELFCFSTKTFVKMVQISNLTGTIGSANLLEAGQIFINAFPKLQVYQSYFEIPTLFWKHPSFHQTYDFVCIRLGKHNCLYMQKSQLCYI